MAADIGFHLARREAGTGPTVLFLHGAFMDHTLWDAVLPGIAERFHVVAPDLRGHGASAPPPSS
ncbi:alpha/beta hydrolase fold protein, partial [mine drainage metagenome]